jgi:hypothetical protein
MDTVLTVEIPEVFENFSVLGNISGKQRLYRERLVDMGEGNDSDAVAGPRYSLSEPGTARVRDDISVGWKELYFATESEVEAGLQAPPVFFESRYIFRAKCAPGVKDVRIYHRLASVTEGFTYSEGWLFGDIDFINTPGRFRLAMDVTFSNGSSRRIFFDFTVVSVKMNLEGDYRKILSKIENERRGLVQNFLSKTFGDSGFDPKGTSNRPVWYAILESIFDFYEKACRKIVLDPHRRYVGVEEYQRASQVRRWTPSLVNRFASMDSEHKERAWFRVERIEAEVDTVENRFVLHTLRDISRQLRVFAAEYGSMKGISRECIDGMRGQAEVLEKIAGHPFFKGVGHYNGGGAQSLVLQKRPGYAQVLTAWVKLKEALSPEGKGLDLGYRPLSSLYEFWTFLAIRDILKSKMPESDGWFFEEKPSIASLEHLLDSDDETVSGGGKTLCRMGYKFSKGRRTVLLAYQQTYGTDDEGDLFANVYEQRPDIVLSIRDGEDSEADVYTYLFDAKYRVDELGGDDASPRDAIDDMHRYRDAILYRKREEGISREAIGAYVLFPGRSGGKTYDYGPMREKENIGAFPMLPSAGGTREIEAFLTELLHRKSPGDHLGEGKVFPTRGTSVVVGAAFSEAEIPTIVLEPNEWPMLTDEHYKCISIPISQVAKMPKNLPALVRLKSNNKAEVIVKVVRNSGSNESSVKYDIEWTPKGYSENCRL